VDRRPLGEKARAPQRLSSPAHALLGVWPIELSCGRRCFRYRIY
jgi:hypothetical protein